eukprot:951599_1
MPGNHPQLAEQQRHIEQLHLVSNQIIGQAQRIIDHGIGDQNGVISRIYQLQSALNAHEWDGNALEEMLNYLECLITAVARVDDCQEEKDDDDGFIDEGTEHYVRVIHAGEWGRPSYDISRDLLENFIDQGYGATRIAVLFG